MKAMKIATKDKQHSKEVQEALFDMGYEWGPWGKVAQNSNKYLYVGQFNDNLITQDTDQFYFDQHSNPEHWLLNGEFVDASYFAYPATEKVYAPLPFLSRTEHERLRIIALAEQIASLASAKDSVPYEYAEELSALVARATNRENMEESDF